MKSKINLKTSVVLVAIAVAAAIIVVVLAARSSGTYEFKTDGMQYYAGMQAVVKAGTKLKVKKDGPTMLETSNSKISSQLPVYLKETNAVILTADMIYYQPRINETFRILALSEVEMLTDGTVRISRNGKSTITGPGFLYDGKDFFLFTEPVTAEFNGYTVNLSTGSYVEAVYGGSITSFDFLTKEFMLEPSDGFGKAFPTSKDYEVSLFADAIRIGKDGKQLLISRPDLLEPLV